MKTFGLIAILAGGVVVIEAFKHFGSGAASTASAQTVGPISNDALTQHLSTGTTTAPGALSQSQLDSVTAQALQIAGAPADWQSQIEWIVGKESANNPNAVNPQSVNGENATGLGQTLPSTFQQYALPGYGNILDPLDNLIATIRYIQARYQSPYNTNLIASENAGIGY